MKRLLYIVLIVWFRVLSMQAQEISTLDENLLLASWDGDSAQVDSLIKKGANTNAVSYEGTTPLMLAARNGHTGIAEILIANGASVEARTREGVTALILAVTYGNIQTAEFLIRKGGDPDLADSRGISPLMYAIQVDSFYLPDMLLYYGADVNHKDEKNSDALMMACLHGRFEIAVRLLEAGADINSVDNDGNTPLHYATSSGNKVLMELLIINGAEIDKKNNSGYTPLAVAVSMNNYEASFVLISYGADVNTRIRPSLNPLGMAISNRNDSIVNLLRTNGAEKIHRPDFGVVSLSTGLAFNKDDSRVNIEFGMSDRRYYLMPALKYSIRPVAVRVLEDGDPGVYYQYWERRHFLNLGLSKGFFIRHFKSGLTTAAYTGVGGSLTFGSFRGSSEHPDLKILFNPVAGVMFEVKPLRIKIGYEYLDLHQKSYSNSWLSISIDWIINSRSKNIIP